MLKRLLNTSFILMAACSARPIAEVTRSSVESVQRYGGVKRQDFNARAQERFLPLFWRADANNNASIEPDELVVLEGPWTERRADFVSAGSFTPRFAQAFEEITRVSQEAALSANEQSRRAALRAELAQGKPTLVETDLSTLSEADRQIFAHLAQAARHIEKLYALQHGTVELEASIPGDDVLSKAVFYRNQSPFCVAPKTESDSACHALPTPSQRMVGLYPRAIQQRSPFCAQLEKAANKAALMDHFSTVEQDGAGFKAVPYSQAYAPTMELVAVELERAATALPADEGAFQQYLRAAAQAFRTNDWDVANEAWVAMGPLNSKWYLRVGPDETYHEPCNWKAGFALQLARINLASLEWQKRLEPVKGEMENILASLAGPPYRARDVKFKLPDFIDVVLNAGDQRAPHGATIGQSLPNWGRVAERGGRTVVMTNLYTDADSRETLQKQAASLFCKATFAGFSSEPDAGLLSVVLHEAAHNLGPTHDYRAGGKTDREAFGGPLAATMEELKAQTSALFLTWWLVEKGLLSQEQAQHATLRDVVWAFGHISRGMYDGAGGPKPYSQLASIQLGAMLREGALVWKVDETAAGGADVGCFEVDVVRWRERVKPLAARVFRAKARGDKKDAEAMKATWVDAQDDWAERRAVIAERWLRAPKATFVYSIKREAQKP